MENTKCKKCKGTGQNRAGSCATCAGSGRVILKSEGGRLIVTPVPVPTKTKAVKQ